MAKSGYAAEAVVLGTTWKGLVEYTPLWGIIKDVRGLKGRTRLMYAARSGDVERFTWFLARGADPRPVDDRNYSALHYATFYGHEIIVQRLIELRVDVNGDTSSRLGRALNFAAANHYKEVVQMLIAAGAKSNEHTSAVFDAIDEQYPFHMNRTNPSPQDTDFADKVSAEIVDILYGAGNSLRVNEITAAFTKVIARGQLRTLKALIANGCNPMAYYYVLQHEPFLHLAIAHRRTEVLRELCKVGMWINGVDTQGRSPLDMIEVWKKAFSNRMSQETETKLNAMEAVLLQHGAKKMMYRTLRTY